ncbi:hypothetical protein ACG873_00820 (plasmid) [Mesorhizobium sp. AaZ16]|uniref:hypothetical protein n=1 Tax=Mesorhizobium sp. AaZ16 TaxID=3402289 RepID=UPI00374EB0F6
MTALFFNSMLADSERREKIRAGSVFVFSATPNTEALIGLARGMLKKAFAAHDPLTVHEHLSVLEINSALSKVKPAFSDHPESRRLIDLIMNERGIDLEELYSDEPLLKTLYPSFSYPSGRTVSIHTHTHSWYSAMPSQINWWLPVNTPEPEDPTEFLPDYFVPPAGGISAFSGQLHGDDPKTTGLARYSIEFRTLHIGEVVGHCKSGDIDTRYIGARLRGYTCAADASRLLTEEIAKRCGGGFGDAAKVFPFRTRPAADC